MKHSLLFILVLLTAHTAFSQPGSIDNSFGENGFSSTTDFGYHNAVIQQPDGKLITTGNYSKGGVIRFLADGSLDSSFGNSGFFYPKGGFLGYDLTLLADNKILIVGSARDDSNESRSVVVRLLANGKADSSFGQNGFAFTPIYKDYSGYDHLQILKDGTIVISGHGQTDIQAVVPEYSYISFISPNGVFNAEYGDNGRVLNYTNVDDKALALQKDGKILVGGYNFPGNQNFVLSRYNEDGSLDNNFGNEGTVSTDGVGQDFLTAIQIQEDGKIVVGGYSQGEVNYMAALRYQTDGTLDNSFGNEGKIFVGFGNLSASALATLLQPDGKIILTGTASTFEASPKSSFAMCRLNNNGTIDSSFAIDGRSVTSYLNYNSSALCSVLQKDGKIVLGGEYYNSRKGYNSYLLARFNGDGQKKSLIAKVRHWLNNHGIGWKGLDNTIVNYYSVQYSKNGNHFIEAKRISGLGSFSAKDYNCPLSETGCYRVVAVDKNGYKTISNSILLNESDVAAASGVYPNPAKSAITVYGLQSNARSSINITDGAGNIKMRGVSSGATQYQTSVGNLPTGTYYLNIITAGGKTESLRLMKE